MTVRVVVPISGGKDSQACLKLALQAYSASEVRGLFCDTKFEHPINYAHVEKLRTLYGDVKIDVVNAGSVEQQCLKHERFPGGGARFCTEELKIWPSKRYYKALAEQQGGFEVWYGMREAESHERAKRYAGKVCDELYAPHEVMRKWPQYLAKMGVKFRLAILDWSKFDVLEFLDGKENPLYGEGFDRVGCFPCLASGDRWKLKAFQHDDFGKSQYELTQIISSKIGKSVWTSKAMTPSDQGCLICSI